MAFEPQMPRERILVRATALVVGVVLTVDLFSIGISMLPSFGLFAVFWLGLLAAITALNVARPVRRWWRSNGGGVRRSQ